MVVAAVTVFDVNSRQSFGYENVPVLAAGIKGWLSACLPTEQGE